MAADDVTQNTCRNYKEHVARNAQGLQESQCLGTQVPTLPGVCTIRYNIYVSEYSMVTKQKHVLTKGHITL